MLKNFIIFECRIFLRHLQLVYLKGLNIYLSFLHGPLDAINVALFRNKYIQHDSA